MCNTGYSSLLFSITRRCSTSGDTPRTWRAGPGRERVSGCESFAGDRSSGRKGILCESGKRDAGDSANAGSAGDMQIGGSFMLLFCQTTDKTKRTSNYNTFESPLFSQSTCLFVLYVTDKRGDASSPYRRLMAAAAATRVTAAAGCFEGMPAATA